MSLTNLYLSRNLQAYLQRYVLSMLATQFLSALLLSIPPGAAWILGPRHGGNMGPGIAAVEGKGDGPPGGKIPHCFQFHGPKWV